MADLKLKILMEAAEKISAPFKRATQSTDTLRASMKSATEKVRDLEKASANVEAFARLKREAKANATALAEAQAKAQELGRALEGTGNGTKKAQTEFARARREVDRLKQAQASNASETAIMRARLGEASISTRTLAASQRQLKRDLDAARTAATNQAKALDAARAKTTALAKAREKMGRTMGMQANMAVGGAAGMAMGGGALALGSGMAGAGISFGEQMSAVGAVARIDKTSAEFKMLSDQAKELGANTSFSASEAGAGMQKLAMAGFEANQIYAAMPGMLNLAKAGATDLGQTADIASNILSAFGMKASEMDRLGDVMTATFTRSNVDLQMLGETMKYTAPIANQFGASVEDVAAMSGLLGNIGIQGSNAGTALRSLFTRMAAPPKEARDALLQLGVATQDASGNMRSMTDILGDVAKKTEGMGGGERLAAFTAIAGQEAGSSLAELVTKGGTGEITKFVEILKNAKGESARVAAAMGDNAAGDIKGFSSAVEGLNIALTETNDAPLRSLIQSATSAVRGIQGWVTANPMLAGTLIKVAAAVAGLVFVGGFLATMIAGLLGPFAMARFALTALGINAGFAGGAMKLLTGGFGLAGKAATVLFPMLATGIKTVGLAFAANPIGLAVMAIAAGAALVIAYWEPISAFFADLWGGISEGFAAAWEVILSGIEAIKGPLTWIGGIFDKVFGGGEAQQTPDDEHADAQAAPKRAPVKIAPAPAASAMAAPAMAGAVNLGGVTITVNAAPGQSAVDIAKQVRIEFDKLMARTRGTAGARLYDEEN